MKSLTRYAGFFGINQFRRSKDWKEMKLAYERWKNEVCNNGAKAVWDKAGEIYAMKLVMEVLLDKGCAAALDTVPAAIKQVDWYFTTPEFKDGKFIGQKSAFQRFADAVFCDEYVGDIMAVNENTEHELQEIIREFAAKELSRRRGNYYD